MRISSDETRVLTQQIMHLLQGHWRTVTDAHMPHQHDARCFKKHRRQMEQLIRLGRTITFVLPAFPAKSPNREKTAGALPDLGERLALTSLNDICKQIHAIYPMGAQMVICSDGRVFSDLVQVTDKDVDSYATGIRQILVDENLTHLSTFSLDDIYRDITHDNMRRLLAQRYGDLVAVIKSRINVDEKARQLFNGIHRFIFEDRLITTEATSKNKIREQSKEIAYQVIQRSNAWSKLVEQYFPEAIRLSIHPQSCDSNKMGVMLLKSEDKWATPWHRVVLKDGNETSLIRKKEAEARHAEPVYLNDQFSHYAMTTKGGGYVR